jgi:C4-type Zn-finger protein
MPDTNTPARTKECPLCCEMMRLRSREWTDRIPGTGQTVKHVVGEWECPECSYEEEIDDDG